MNELDKNGLDGDSIRSYARIKLFEAIQNGTDLTPVENYYLEHAHNICLPHDVMFAMKRAKESGSKILLREEAMRSEVFRRYRLDIQVALRFRAEDPTILGPIKNLRELIEFERNKMG